MSFNNTTTGVMCGLGTADPSGAHECTPGFWRGSCCSIFSCMRCGSLFVLLLFFFWSLYCLFYFDLRFLITLCIFENEINFDETTIRFNSVVKQRIFISKMKKKSSFETGPQWSLLTGTELVKCCRKEFRLIKKFMHVACDANWGDWIS